jgi:hypothetical protein
MLLCIIINPGWAKREVDNAFIQVTLTEAVYISVPDHLEILEKDLTVEEPSIWWWMPVPSLVSQFSSGCGRLATFSQGIAHFLLAICFLFLLDQRETLFYKPRPDGYYHKVCAGNPPFRWSDPGTWKKRAHFRWYNPTTWWHNHRTKKPIHSSAAPKGDGAEPNDPLLYLQHYTEEAYLYLGILDQFEHIRYFSNGLVTTARGRATIYGCTRMCAYHGIAVSLVRRNGE